MHSIIAMCYIHFIKNFKLKYLIFFKSKNIVKTYCMDAKKTYLVFESIIFGHGEMYKKLCFCMII